MNLWLFPPQTYPHLSLTRHPQVGRRRRRRRRRLPALNPREHGAELRVAAERTIAAVRARPQPREIDPALVLKVRTREPIPDRIWHQANLTVVGSDSDKTLIVFSDDEEMAAFRGMIDAYTSGRKSRPGQRHPDYRWLEAIDLDSVSALEPEDRMGPRLRELYDLGGPDPDTPYRLDAELWYLGDDESYRRLEELGQFLRARSGTTFDSYLRNGICLAAIRLHGRYLSELLAIQSLDTVDLPPQPAFLIGDIVQVPLDEFDVAVPDKGAPRICIIDSGIARGHPLLRDAIGETIAMPSSLGDGVDVHGHGSHVAGIALYYDVHTCVGNRRFEQTYWIDGARVLNEHNEFDEQKLIESQMHEAISYFVEQGCRIFNLSINSREPYRQGDRPSAWAATLDNLAHEHGVLIVVSAGNYDIATVPERSAVDFFRAYPNYLLDPEARIADPATAANALSVGSLAPSGAPSRFGAYLHDKDLAPRLIAEADQPSPFTRSGPGVRGSVKPDLVEYGGNYSYDGRLDQIVRDKGVSTISLNRNYTAGLFSFDHGTSFAAPRVTHLAARVLTEYPEASANLIRALLVHSATLPQGTARLGLSPVQERYLCGFGKTDLERTLRSLDNRVLLMADEVIPLDHIHIYEIPVPDLFKEVPGHRHITITLAYDPPVRHQRAQYFGNAITFHLVRDLTIDEIARTFQQETGERLLGKYKCALEPGPVERRSGTVQRATWSITRSSSLAHDPFHLVLTSIRGWQTTDHEEQRYAVVVGLEHEEQIELYQAVRQQVRIEQRIRNRV